MSPLSALVTPYEPKYVICRLIYDSMAKLDWWKI